MTRLNSVEEKMGKEMKQSAEWVGSIVGDAGPGSMRGTHPFVRARCGEKNVVIQDTKPHKKGESFPRWSHGHLSAMALPRHPQDNSTLVIELWVHDLKGRDVFVSGNHVKLDRYCNEQPGVEFTETVPLHANGQPASKTGDGASPTDTSTGATITFTIRWDADLMLDDGSDEKGRLMFTPLQADRLFIPDRGIRDLATHRDSKAIWVALGILLTYMLIGFSFYRGYMAEDSESSVLTRIQGGHGDWDTLNTLVFMITSFTTVGYGNQPSMVRTAPMCEYPSTQLVRDNSFSSLLPSSLRGDFSLNIGVNVLGTGSGAEDEEDENAIRPLDPVCFSTPANAMPTQCLLIGDDSFVFDFTKRLLYARQSSSPPYNYTGRLPELYTLEVPGDNGLWDCGLHETDHACWLRFTANCEEQLKVWRPIELKKDVAKRFTVAFILVGMGVLGALAGAIGQRTMAFIRSLYSSTEYLLDNANRVVSAGLSVIPVELATQFYKDLTEKRIAGHGKSVLVASTGLCLVMLFGTIVYGRLESMNFTDAAYFTVVTATTVGFGDYVPQTDGGKLFTILYVPFSVMAVSGAINHIANIAIAHRKETLELIIISQFCKHVTTNDLDDVRRSAGLASKEDIYPNDFLVAMLIRLGKIKASDSEVIKIRQLFRVLDREGQGLINESDIQDVITKEKSKRKRKLSVTGASSPVKGTMSVVFGDDHNVEKISRVDDDTDLGMENPLSNINGHSQSNGSSLSPASHSRRDEASIEEV